MMCYYLNVQFQGQGLKILTVTRLAGSTISFFLGNCQSLWGTY